MLQTVFERYELKYMVSAMQKERICRAMSSYMEPEKYGRTTVRNIYFDTDSYRLIRRSIEKPTYKEKLRIRSYAQATDDSTVFVELKKKYEGIVYKRRVPLPEREAMRWICREAAAPLLTQISREIDYFIRFYDGLKPKVFLSYEREAFKEKKGGDFRVTFDEKVLCRQEDLSLTSPAYGTKLLSDGQILMELKCSGGIPLWMVSLLSAEKLYKMPFSKYGTVYQKLIFPQKHLQNPIDQKEFLFNGCNL